MTEKVIILKDSLNMDIVNIFRSNEAKILAFYCLFSLCAYLGDFGKKIEHNHCSGNTEVCHRFTLSMYYPTYLSFLEKKFYNRSTFSVAFCVLH